jgi:hypothetical protein
MTPKRSIWRSWGPPILVWLAMCATACGRRHELTLPDVMITGGLQGNIEPCGCGGNHSGGLEDCMATAALMRWPGQIWIDAGQSIGGGPLATHVAGIVAEHWAAVNVDCVCLGADEIDLVEELRARLSCPLVCANVVRDGVLSHWDSGGVRVSSIILDAGHHEAVATLGAFGSGSHPEQAFEFPAAAWASGSPARNML